MARPQSRRMVRIVGAALAVCAPIALLVPVTAAGAAAEATASIRTTPLKIIGGPEAGEGIAVVIVVDQRHLLHLDGIAPDTGAVQWSLPYSVSALNSAYSPDPYVNNNVVLDLAPVGKPDNPFVNIYGVNATTGAIVWHGPQDQFVGDSEPCAQGKDDCVVLYDKNATPTLAILDPSSGQVLASVKGAMESVDVDLYQTDAKAETLEAIAPTGTVSWKKTIAELFGSGFDLNNGWYFASYGSTEVATVSPNAQDHSFGLDNAKTIGFSLASGAPAWSLGGSYQCGGPLSFENPPFDCVTTGKLLHPNQNSNTPTYKGLHLSLQGFDPATGKPTWTVAVRNIDPIENGSVAFLDDSRIVVELPNGKTALLDTSDGTTKPIAKDQTMWCSAPLPNFQVDVNKQLNPSRQLTGAPQYFPCTPSGAVASSLPGTQPDNVGITVDGVYLWASPQGLSRSSHGAAEGVA